MKMGNSTRRGIGRKSTVGFWNKSSLLHENQKSPLTPRKASENYSTTTVATAVPKQQNRAAAAFEYTFGGLIEAELTTLALPLLGLVLAYYVCSDDVYWVDISLSASLGETTNSWPEAFLADSHQKSHALFSLQRQRFCIIITLICPWHCCLVSIPSILEQFFPVNWYRNSLNLWGCAWTTTRKGAVGHGLEAAHPCQRDTSGKSYRAYTKH
jgi:hypothetical protein